MSSSISSSSFAGSFSVMFDRFIMRCLRFELRSLAWKAGVVDQTGSTPLKINVKNVLGKEEGRVVCVLC